MQCILESISRYSMIRWSSSLGRSERQSRLGGLAYGARSRGGLIVRAAPAPPSPSNGDVDVGREGFPAARAVTGGVSTLAEGAGLAASSRPVEHEMGTGIRLPIRGGIWSSPRLLPENADSLTTGNRRRCRRRHLRSPLKRGRSLNGTMTGSPGETLGDACSPLDSPLETWT